MTNYSFDSIEEYRDIESINFHAYETALGRPEGDILNHLAKRSRDQGRMPMQWSSGQQAGFTSGEPWLSLNPNYTSINVDQSLRDEQSILHFYRKLIRLRRANRALIYGGYREIYKDSEEIGGYVRTLGNEEWTVICNFTDKSLAFAEPTIGRVILSNLKEHQECVLKPYEALICKAERG